MMSVTHVAAGYTIARVAGLETDETTLSSILPDLDVLFTFIYPFSHRGILHSLLFCVLSGTVYGQLSGSRKKGLSVFLGCLTHLGLDSLTSSGIPLFFPFSGNIGLSLTYASSLYWNLSIISVSIGILTIKKEREVFKQFLRNS